MKAISMGTKFGEFIILAFEPKKDKEFEITLYQFLRRATRSQLISAKRKLMSDYFNPMLPFEWKRGIRSTLLVANASELDDAIYAVNTMLESGNKVILCLDAPTSPDLSKVISKYGNLKVMTVAKLLPKISREYILTKSFVTRILNSSPNALLINVFDASKPRHARRVTKKTKTKKVTKPTVFKKPTKILHYSVTPKMVNKEYVTTLTPVIERATEIKKKHLPWIALGIGTLFLLLTTLPLRREQT